MTRSMARQRRRRNQSVPSAGRDLGTRACDFVASCTNWAAIRPSSSTSPHILADWLAEPVRSFVEDWGTTAARTVPVGKNARGTIYRTEWLLDRAKHGVPVQSLVIRSTNKGVPIILGLTGVTQW